MDNTKIKIKKTRPSGAKKGWKFNFLDVLILLLILLFAMVSVIMLLPQAMDIIGGAGNVQIVYTVVFDEVDENLALTANIYDGQTVVDGNTGKILGTVTGDALVGDCYQSIISDKLDVNGGVLIESAILEGKKTVTVTIQATASYSEGSGYEVNGQRIAANREYEMIFPGFTGEGVCTVVTVNKD